LGNFPAQQGNKNFHNGILEAPASNPATSKGKMGWREIRKIAHGPYRSIQRTSLLYPGVFSGIAILFPK